MLLRENVFLELLSYRFPIRENFRKKFVEFWSMVMMSKVTHFVNNNIFNKYVRKFYQLRA